MTNLFLSTHRREAMISALKPSFILLAPTSRSLLLIVVAISFAISLGSIGPNTLTEADADLMNLLRFMAALKGLMAIAVLVAVFWRLAAPVGSIRLAFYAIALSTMVAGPGLIWNMDHIGLGAVLLHGGLFASVVLLWRDPAMATQLKRTVEERAQRRRSGAIGS